MMRRFQRLLVLASMVFVATVTFLAPNAYAAKKAKVDVCHIPPGNPSNFHTISVNENALAAHLAHGDIEGACADAGDILCADGDLCTVAAFEEGTEICLVNQPVNCDDGDPGTLDSCNSATGCVNEPIPEVVCNDNNVCTIDEFIPDTEICLAVDDRDLINCDDGDPSTADSCDAVGGCVNEPIPEIICDDGNVCTIDEFIPGTEICLDLGDRDQISCDDGDPSTADSCDAIGGCINEPIPEIVCDDGNLCTIDDFIPGTEICLAEEVREQIICDDGDPNTLDSCGRAVGCINIPQVAAVSQNLSTDGIASLNITLTGTAAGLSGGDSLLFAIATAPLNGALGSITPIQSTNGFCSVTSTTACTLGGTECPATEACVLPPITSASVTYTPNIADTSDGFDFTVAFNGAQSLGTVTISGPEGEGTPPDSTTIEVIDDSVEILVGDSVDLTLNASAPSTTGDLFFTTTNPLVGTLTAPVPIPTNIQDGNCSINTTFTCQVENDICPQIDPADFCVAPPQPAIRSATTTYTHTGSGSGIDTFDFQACETANPTVCSTTSATFNIEINEETSLVDDKEVSGSVRQPIEFDLGL